MPAKILFRDAQGRDGAVDLRGEPVWVGRAMECAIRTDDAMVSRKHSMIRFEGGRYWVEDLGSSNGTHVNDVKVQRQALNHNDVVRCGSLWLRYVEEGSLFPTTASGGVAPTSMATGGQSFGYQSTVASPARPGTFNTAGGRPQSIAVDIPGDLGERDRYRAQADEFRARFESVTAERDKEVAENKRLRAENTNLSQRIDDQRTQMKESEEVIEAHKRVAEELRGEMDILKERDGRMASELAEAKEDLASRTRQLQRSNDDIAKIKGEIETNKRQVAELSKIKDDGFRKLNEQLSEVEHLREVIREQERMLEERRVGLISLEEAIKELRQEREARIKEIAQMKGERDEVRIGFNRLQAQAQATEEENRRLARLMQDIGDSGEVMRLSRQLKDAQFEAEEQQAERNRVAEALKVAEARIEKLTADLAKVESSGSAEEAKAKAALADLHKLEDARLKAENGRSKAEQERGAAVKALEEEQAELERLRRKLEAAESAPKEAARPDPGLDKKVQELQEQLVEAEHRAAESKKRLEDIMGRAARLEDQNDELTKKLKAVEGNAKASAAATGGGGEIKDKALEVYHSVNDVLAELRVNISVVRDEFDTFAGKNPDARARTIRDAIEAAAGQTEDVKGVLRNLRELAET